MTVNITSIKAENFCIEDRVYYADTDHSGIVYHANYLRYMEKCRTEWLRYLGVDQIALLSEHNLAFTLAEFQLKYIIPARFDDRLLITAMSDNVGKASISIKQAVYRILPNDECELLCTGATRAACLDVNTLRLARFPVTMFNKIQHVS